MFTKKSEYFGTVHRKDMKNLFVIHHYATTVKYTVGNANIGKGGEGSNDDAWIFKNVDTIPNELELLYQQSNLAEFRSLGVAGDLAANSNKEPKRRKSVMLKPTIVASFVKSMQELNELLDSTTCHFIRCIKPNTLAKPGVFNLSYVVEQVRALGILQACEILSISLPTRISYVDLKTALVNTVTKLTAKFPLLNTEEGNVLLISTILKAYQIPEDSYRLGVTIAFFRPGQLAFIDRILNASSADTENVIAKSIESAIEQYTTIMNDITKISDQIKVAAEFVNQLESRQDRLRTNLTLIPQNQGLDLPEDISKLLGEIESKYTNQQSKRRDLLKQKSQIESLLLTKNINRGKSKKGDDLLDKINTNYLNKIKELETQHYTQMNEGYDGIHSTIESLEELNNKQIDPELMKLVENNDKLYEKVMDHVTAVERLISELKFCAQRGKIEEAYSKYSSINSLIIEINNVTQELSTGIELGSQGLAEHEESISNINFDNLESQIQDVLKFFTRVNTLGQQLSETYLTFSNEIQSFTEEIPAPSPVKPPPPPPPGRPAPPGAAPPPPPSAPAIVPVPANGLTPSQPPPKPVRSRGGEENIRGSVNFSIKDLAAMRKKSLTTTNEEASSIAKASEFPQKPITSQNNNELPADWKELFDPKTQRPYYVHRVTKQRQWQRPTAESTENDNASVNSGNSGGANNNVGRKERVKSVRIQNTGNLPPNWRELIDKKSGRPYYVNDITKERQWRRPEETKVTSDISPTKIENVDRLSKRVSKRMSNLPLEEINQDLQKVSIAPSKSIANPLVESTYQTPSKPKPGKGGNLSDDKIQRARRLSALILSEELTPDESINESMKQTISYLQRVGHQMKTGYLQKQSKLLGRWRKRFFVLKDQQLFYFDSEKEYNTALKLFTLKQTTNLAFKSEKQLQLTALSQVSYTTTENCFSIVNPGTNSKDDEETWYLLANDENDLEEWMKAINGHVHVSYLLEKKLEGKDYWELGNVSLSLWKVPTPNSSNTARRPVGIRSVPDVDGPRTGEGLFAGEIIEIVQTIDEKEKNQKYLRLADDRGWVFENHPLGQYSILTPAGGKLIEEFRTYEYLDEFLETLPVYASPKCSPDNLVEGFSFPPGSRMQICAEWSISSSQLKTPNQENKGGSGKQAGGKGEEEGGEEDEDEEVMFSFLKLRDGRGWVEMFHPVTGGQLLRRID